ncbi:nucleoside-diphosphate sugar epimerase/dehydratase [Zobellella maritima]|uniref:nucleoside-diphosphate sugar epimerase/dehydratase n=1 Tax=Zobellella maritima TaxID=2059725 RepID=UPI000E305BFD|nr:nucleoside-diphosphate sugar epimerase/dehydratase [Zobellella maritima]
MDKAIRWLFRQPRKIKRLIILAVDIIFITLAFWSAFIVRLESLEQVNSPNHWWVLMVLVPVSLLFFIRLGLYRAVLRYLGYHAIMNMLFGIVMSAVVMVLVSNYLDAFLPRSVPVIYSAFAFILCGGVRSSAHAIYNKSTEWKKTPVIIYGAGDAGRQLHIAFRLGNEYRAVAFIDDNSALHRSLLHGVTVYPPSKIPWLVEYFDAKKLLLAMPGITRQRRREIVEGLEHIHLEILSIPGIADIVSGKTRINDLRELSIEELLGRDPVAPFPELISANIRDKVVMVTGAGGSIGSELCRQIIQQNPKILVLFEMSEYALYMIEQELSGICQRSGLKARVMPLLGTVQRQSRLETAMRTFGVQTVYHAAAFKHVPMVEYNVVEGVRNNVFGTWRAAEAAINCKVETFVLISSDKAVRPTNVMGTSKRLAELVLQGLALRQDGPRFSIVRFGNVLGSSGSVVPLFKKQIRSGGPITLTHENITRYFMTIPEAAQLVIQAGSMAKGGDVFVLDMGKPVRIIDLAHKMLYLMGYRIKDKHNPGGDIEIKITGLRPGEKLYEELLIGGDNKPTQHPRIRTSNEAYLPWDQVAKLLAELHTACDLYDLFRIRDLLIKAPTEFHPQDGICDLIWMENNETKDIINPHDNKQKMKTSPSNNKNTEQIEDEEVIQLSRRYL